MILKAAEPTEYTEIYDMVDKAFKGAELPSKIIKVTTIEDVNFQKEDLRVVKVDGKIVSAMMIIRRPLRLGTAIVKGAIVAPVATHPDYQGKGYCSKVMRDAVQYMKAQGFDITILWGIPWLYPHYGYSPSMLRSEIVIKPKYISPLEKVSYESRPLIEADLERITHIYHGNTAIRTCAELRTPATWEWKPGGAEVKFEVFTDEKGEVVGYCTLGTDWGRPCAHEIGVLNNEACGFIFNHLLKIAKQKTVEEFYCLVHPEHPFTRFAFWRDGEIRIRSGGGAGMVRVLNLFSLLTNMKREFERRLARSEFHEIECDLKILSEEGFAVLNINHGKVSVSMDNIKTDYQLDIPLAFLNPLITGYKGISELSESSDVKVRGGELATRLIEVLFPIGFPSGGMLPVVWD